jgi:hypothetical protein
MVRGEEIAKTSPAEIEKLIEQNRETNLEPGVCCGQLFRLDGETYHGRGGSCEATDQIA